MSHLNVPCVHALGKDKALQLAKELLANALAEHGSRVKGLVQNWDSLPYHCDFSFSVKAAFLTSNASGTIDVTDSSVVIDGEVSGPATMVVGKIEKTIQEHWQTALAKAQPPPKPIRPKVEPVTPVATTIEPVRGSLVAETPSVAPETKAVTPETTTVTPETPSVKPFDWAEYHRQIDVRADRLR